MNIRLRLTLWYTAIFSIILVIFSLVVYVGLTRSLMNSVDNHLQREVGEILGNLHFEAEEDEHAVELSYSPEEGVYWRILDAAGQSLIDPGHFEGASFKASLTNMNNATLENAELVDGTPVRLYTAPFVIEHHGSGLVQVAESYRHIQDVQRQLIALLGIGIPLTLLASSAGGWFLAASALDPIDRITRAARQISARDLHQRLKLDLPNDEVGRLAATFDQMLERLEDAFEQQKRFIADASHEMKTPLTILKGDVEVALARPRSPETYQETLENVNQTTDQLIALVQELLLLARADNQQSLLTLDYFNLAEMLTEQTASFMPKAIKEEIALNVDLPGVLVIEADRNKLSRLFMNLIDNALKYSRPGDAVLVNASIINGQACVTIADTGPGIAPEHLPHLFDRFYRVDKARSRVSANGQTSGAGLGLSIVQWLAQAHSGRVEVDSTIDQGTTFTVWLPLKQGQPVKKWSKLMKNLGFILVSAVTVPILLLVGVYLLWPQRAQPQPPLVISIDSDLAPIETHLAEHEAEVQGQLEDIHAEIQQQQNALEVQTDTWLKQMADSQQQLEKLQAQAQDINLQIGQLEITRTTRLAAQQSELNNVRQQTQARLAELEHELAETRSKLEQVKNELGN